MPEASVLSRLPVMRPLHQCEAFYQLQQVNVRS